jgi:diadenosine tetraphosphatase ApaH/serine/threonine PP2A family protein phosphatase
MVWADRDGRIDAISPGPGSVFRLDGRPALLNPGSVGQPRDGDPTASWLEIDTDAGVATWRRISYDVEAVRSAMLDVGLPARLAERLRAGL